MNLSKLTQFLETPNGRFSSNRLVYIIGSLGILIIWAIKELNTVGAYEPSENIVWIFAGLQCSGVWNKYAEKPNTTVVIPNTETK